MSHKYMIMIDEEIQSSTDDFELFVCWLFVTEREVRKDKGYIVNAYVSGHKEYMIVQFETFLDSTG